MAGCGVLIDWTGDVDRWMTWIEERGGPALEWMLALLGELEDLDRAPAEETATFERVRGLAVTSRGDWLIPSIRTLPCGSSSGSRVPKRR